MQNQSQQHVTGMGKRNRNRENRHYSKCLIALYYVRFHSPVSQKMYSRVQYPLQFFDVYIPTKNLRKLHWYLYPVDFLARMLDMILSLLDFE